MRLQALLVSGSGTVSSSTSNDASSSGFGGEMSEDASDLDRRFHQVVS